MKTLKEFLNEDAKTVPEKSILDSIDLGSGKKFVVVSRTGGGGSQDKVRMLIIDKSGTIKYDLGSHTNVKAAMRFGKNHSKNDFKDVIS